MSCWYSRGSISVLTEKLLCGDTLHPMPSINNCRTLDLLPSNTKKMSANRTTAHCEAKDRTICMPSTSVLLHSSFPNSRRIVSSTRQAIGVFHNPNKRPIFDLRRRVVGPLSQTAIPFSAHGFVRQKLIPFLRIRVARRPPPELPVSAPDQRNDF